MLQQRTFCSIYLIVVHLGFDSDLIKVKPCFDTHNLLPSLWVLQVGSGLGYWAMLLRARGVDINAYDKVTGAPDATNVKSSNNKSASKKKGQEVKCAANPEKVFAADEGDETPSFWIKVGGARSCCGITLFFQIAIFSATHALDNEKISSDIGRSVGW